MTAAQAEAALEAELESGLRDALGGRSMRLTGHERLKDRVRRMRVEVDGSERSVVVKWLEPLAARRNSLVARRWLPAAGLADVGPSLVGIVPARSGEGAWLVYEDMGGRPLETDPPVGGEIEAAVEAIARVHTTFADHPLLPECRLAGGDRGVHFFSANLRDGIAALRALAPRGGARAVDAREALLARMQDLQRQERERAEALAASGGPETLLHGDLWPTNAVLLGEGNAVRLRLIDWDEAGVGPAGYDVSTLLLRFTPEHRPWILDAYRRAVRRLAGWELPPQPDLNVIFATAAQARLASLLVWSVSAAGGDPSGWLGERLESLVAWFDEVEPVLP